MRIPWLLVLPVAVSACATARGRADDAFARADYVAAADQYEALIESSPDGASLRPQRDAARSRALAVLVLRARDARLAGRTEQAETALAELLSRREAWPDASGIWTAGAIETEIAAATAHFRSAIAQLIAARQPLGAEAVVAAQRARFPFDDFAPLWPELAGDVRVAGQAQCAAVTPADAEASPYLARLTTAYCAHFGVVTRAPARLAQGIGGLEIEGAVSGMTGPQRDRFEAAVDRALRASAWYEGADDAPLVDAELSGTQAATYAAAEVTLEAPWTERVSYQATESYQEAYQESYTEQVPYTTYHTESYSCGFGTSQHTCTRSVSSTSYRSETRHRTAYRTAYRTVTRYRDEPRVFVYDAIARTGNYSGSWLLSLGLAPGARPLAVRVDATDRETGYDHDADFPPAGVEPSRAHLSSFDDWFEQLLARLGADLPVRLAAHWEASFCRERLFTAETAARCAYGAAAPTPARTELARLFGKDLGLVLDRFAQARR